MASNKKKAFTLLELLIVVIIVGILATLGSINYGPLKERTLDRESKAILKLIVAAQRIYRMENSFYYPYDNPPANVSGINDKLKLVLPTTGTLNWTYAIPAAQTGTATAGRSGGGRTWTLTPTDNEPVCSGTGCP